MHVSFIKQIYNKAHHTCYNLIIQSTSDLPKLCNMRTYLNNSIDLYPTKQAFALFTGW